MFKTIDLDKLVKYAVEEVKREKIEAEITITPTEINLKFNPWKPFEYSCPYKNSGEV